MMLPASFLGKCARRNGLVMVALVLKFVCVAEPVVLP